MLDPEVEAVVHGLRAEPVHQAADLDCRRLVDRHDQIPISAKATAKIASRMITRKIDSTTARVVCRPTLSALPDTPRPLWQPTRAITRANTGALIRPVRKLQTVTPDASCARNCPEDRSSRNRQATAPPASPATSANTVSAGSATTRSEEHTSELQSLMRISYAVFCLKKKNTQNQTHI